MEKSDLPNKQAIVDEIHNLVGAPLAPLGPGSKEHRSTLLAVAEFIGLQGVDEASKLEIGKQIVEALGGEWDSSCRSAGETITKFGMNQVLVAINTYISNTGGTQVSENGASLGTFSEAGEESDEEDERIGLEAAIAEDLSAMSRAEETPDVILSTPPFEAEEVDFQTNLWMSCLASVQGFMRYRNELSINSPKEFMTALLENLGFNLEDTESKKAIANSALSLRHVEKLHDSVEHANLLFQDFFLVELEAGLGRTDATLKWLAAWEESETEEEFEEEGVTGHITASAQTLAINELADHAKMGRLNLSPSYQRGDVWPIRDSQLLIESILRGIPLPSLILLKPRADVGSLYEVVDGKQRLTAILRFIGQHPTALKKVNELDARYPDEDLKDLFNSDYPKFKKKWKNLTGNVLTGVDEKLFCFPFKTRRASKDLGPDFNKVENKYYSQIRDEELQIGESRVNVYEIFEISTAYKLSVIVYSKASPKQIHEVFHLYNRQGKHLNAEEIRNAIFHSGDLMRALIVCSGDNPNFSTVAPFLEPEWPSLSEVGNLLEQYRFGTIRYRRTKVLSWLLATVVNDFNYASTRNVRIQSTAREIDTMLERAQNIDTTNPLQSTDNLILLLKTAAIAIDAHSAVDEAWAPKFRDPSENGRWQELTLIASLVGVLFAAFVAGPDIKNLLIEHAKELSKKSKTEWKRPEKTQSKSQWEYTAKVALGILEVLEIDPLLVALKVEEQFGSCGLPALVALQSQK